MRALLPACGMAVIVAAAAPLLAHPPGSGGPGWGLGAGGYYPPYYPPYGTYRSGYGPREGTVDATHYIANGTRATDLGQGPVKVAAAAGSMASGTEQATYESALVDQLVKAGYQSDAPPEAKGQVVEFVVSHDQVVPPEPPHSPVSGQVSVLGSNRGSAVGVALAVDLSKPAKALVATRLDARIRDSETNVLLWEGHAQILTREGDTHWSTDKIATRLAAALFRGFPLQG